LEKSDMAEVGKSRMRCKGKEYDEHEMSIFQTNICWTRGGVVGLPLFLGT
jgi:hypothetical protein